MASFDNLVKPQKAIVPNGYVSKKEVFGFCFGGMGQNMIYMWVSTYIMFFFTDVARIPVAAATAIIVIARIWDAVNDPMMGVIVDRTKPNKLGKFRPYLLATPILMATFTTLSFVALKPEASTAAKVIWALFSYIGWGMTYTISDIPFWGITAAISPLPNERAKFLSIARVVCSMGAMISMALAPSFIQIFGGEYSSKAYLICALIFGGVGGAMFLTVGLMCRDKVPAEKDAKTLKDNLAVLKKNKPLFLIFLAGVLSCCRALAQSAATYIAMYNYQGYEISLFGGAFVVNGMNISLVVAAGFGAGLFIGMMLVPALSKKLDYRQMFIYSSIFGFVVQFVMFFFGYQNIWLVAAFLFFAGIPFGFYNVLTYAMIGDCVQYYEWKTGERTEGFSFSLQTFMTKLGAGIAVGVTGLVLIIAKFQKPDAINAMGLEIFSTEISAGETVNIYVQKESTLTWLYALLTIIPAISTLISIIPLFKYELTGKRMKEINDELAKRRNLDQATDNQVVLEAPVDPQI